MTKKPIVGLDDGEGFMKLFRGRRYDLWHDEGGIYRIEDKYGQWQYSNRNLDRAIIWLSQHGEGKYDAIRLLVEAVITPLVGTRIPTVTRATICPICKGLHPKTKCPYNKLSSKDLHGLSEHFEKSVGRGAHKYELAEIVAAIPGEFDLIKPDEKYSEQTQRDAIIQGIRYNVFGSIRSRTNPIFSRSKEFDRVAAKILRNQTHARLKGEEEWILLEKRKNIELWGKLGGDDHMQIEIDGRPVAVGTDPAKMKKHLIKLCMKHGIKF
jgi:hypothetical protein